VTSTASLMFGVLAALTIAFTAAAQTPPHPRPQDVQVGIVHEAVVILDGHPSTLADVDARFRTAEKAGGMVWYFRDPSTAKSDADMQAAHQLFDLIARHHLSITLSSKSDYSDYVDMQDGSLHPRSAQ